MPISNPPLFRTREPNTAIILGMMWRVRTAPDGLPDGCDYHIDHEDRVVWLSPRLTSILRARSIELALERAAFEASAVLPLVS